MLIEYTLSRLQKLHQLLKLDYLQHALEKNLPNFGLGNEKNNRNTIDFLKETLQSRSEFVKEHGKILKFLRESEDYEENYSALRELYMISPSIHEIYFFESHFKFRVESIVKGRLGLKALLKALAKNYSPTLKGAKTYLTKNCILLENQYSGSGTPSLLEVEPTSDPYSLAEEIVEEYDSKESRRQMLDSEIIERMFSTVHGLLDEEDYDLLRSEKLASKDKWLYYAPCSINEGPLFLLGDEMSLTELSTLIDVDNPRGSLSEHLWIWDYRKELGKLKDSKLILKKIDSIRDELSNKFG